ncbi:hypothetical protein QPL79_02170 [Ignisphaera sp. 4213-co]|uniref:Uncharacterized protein n=1 Tax=Ignisphaera cupida TaxID=3050454 RepID=A0ABD4Z5I8_9CREN|nr:hypothetical protein [Ignisphaera sp. 4213-co]MDK6028170.1 hypothetical protein [Ignisphaera sp. 4213-co]
MFFKRKKTFGVGDKDMKNLENDMVVSPTELVDNVLNLLTNRYGISKYALISFLYVLRSSSYGYANFGYDGYEITFHRGYNGLSIEVERKVGDLVQRIEYMLDKWLINQINILNRDVEQASSSIDEVIERLKQMRERIGEQEFNYILSLLNSTRKLLEQLKT